MPLLRKPNSEHPLTAIPACFLGGCSGSPDSVSLVIVFERFEGLLDVVNVATHLDLSPHVR
jgi:hypothetical protein